MLESLNLETVHIELIEGATLNIDVDLVLTMAQHEVRNIPISFRKCRYTDESNLKYFQVRKE